jgi:MFS family permease
MNIIARIVVFGTCSGLIWSLAPGVCVDLFHDSRFPLALILIICALIGILISALFAVPLLKANRWSTLLLGVLALLLGAFCFGFFDSLFESSSDNPFKLGLTFAFFSTFSPFAIALIPCAVLTTFLYRKCLLMTK